MPRHGSLRVAVLAAGVIVMGWTGPASEAADDVAMWEMSKGDAMQPSGSHWIVAENQPCQVYNLCPEPGESVTWSGGCGDGRAEGELDWRSSDALAAVAGDVPLDAAVARDTGSGALWDLGLAGVPAGIAVGEWQTLSLAPIPGRLEFAPPDSGPCR